MMTVWPTERLEECTVGRTQAKSYSVFTSDIRPPGCLLRIEDAATGAVVWLLALAAKQKMEVIADYSESRTWEEGRVPGGPKPPPHWLLQRWHSLVLLLPWRQRGCRICHGHQRLGAQDLSHI